MTVSSARSGNTGGTEQSWGKRAAAVVKRLRAPEPSRTVRLLVIADMAPELPSDVEGYLDAEAVDVVVLAGDLFSGDLRGLTQTSRPTLGVYGNHCDGQYLAEMGFTNLHLAAVEVAGVTFTGLEGCVRYKTGSSDILYTQEEYRLMVQQLPAADVLVTHCPPRGINDHQDPAHHGIDALRTWIETRPPRLVVHGHTYPQSPMTAFGPTHIEYVQGTRIVTVAT